ncbi:MAG: alpha/beta hydrolase fold domain-containing protein [Lachnospiraceae bacterium]|nr:alpha/beta hydrolase fold domain-containing protein [Lachnospiraceae bacterium]
MATGRIRFYSMAQAGQVDITFVIPNDVSDIMKEGNKNYDRSMKTLYLLHGFSGNDCDWEYNGIAEDIAFEYNMAVIMITAGNNFYLDRKATGCQFGTYAGEEAVEYTRKLFGLSDKREDTFIAGLSMGGFGALHTALAYPETFGGVIALSSALIIHKIAKMKEGEYDDIANYEYYKEVFGDLSKVEESDANPELLYNKLKASGEEIPPIYMAVGTEDFLYDNNQEMKEFLEKNEADFKYEEGPGIHDWKFWNKYITRGIDWILDKNN